ncbi:DUF6602 domain-containing protein [Rhizobacter sp. LjRoot28]|uniref:DUF6602 domain-containing protein n=1 Tax=Rhizobacter sp. LjRoot28 TaxID=3342309 RepID=UPI003ECDF095
MSNPTLPTLLEHLHGQVEAELRTARQALNHPTDKGDASETVWIELLRRYLPSRYIVSKAHVVDSQGAFSDQIDVVVHDRQYSPLVFSFKEALFVPAESVYAVFEAKQDASSETVGYAQKKAASVRCLRRTSMPVPTVDGVRPAKDPGHILAGLLTLSCAWKPPLGETLAGHLGHGPDDGVLDLGCIADAGTFSRNGNDYVLQPGTRAATKFLFELIARLQELGTVPMLDVRAYAMQIP